MAKGFKHGQSGIPLNFKVVAYATEEELNAATPRENTIGIITKNKITGWYFASEQPENMAEGELWVTTDKTSTAPFDALKKNNIMVYPRCAKQMVSGKLVDLLAKSYRGSKWEKWFDGELFDNGNQYGGITGGWVTGENTIRNGDSVNSGTVTVGETLKLVHSANPTESSLTVRTNYKIDLTDYNTIRIEAITFTLNCYIFIASNKTGIVTAYSGEGALTLDVSTVTGEFYVGIAVRNGSVAEVAKVFLE